MSSMTTPKVVIGICAYNEENNIGRLLQNLIYRQNLPKDYKIFVVCSGCTDRTPEIVEKFKKRNAQVETIVQKLRKGKANALNEIFKIARESAEVLVLVNADTLPSDGSIKKIISKLVTSNAGAAYARPIPIKEFPGISHKIACVIWHLHHAISRFQEPKLSGELCAIRTACLQDIPEKVATDEPYIEFAIRRQGYDILYVPEAVVYIRCPTNILDLLQQRKRIQMGHIQLQRSTRFQVSTSEFRNVLGVLFVLKPKEIIYLLLGAFLETIAYLQAKNALSKGEIPFAWDPIKSTKIQLC
jgi:cellulose synthase/poly-beta-1,6-N-acetylglucosamine synthase-like glycosyltransferase